MYCTTLKDRSNPTWLIPNTHLFKFRQLDMVYFRLFCSPKCSFNFNLTWSSFVGIVIVESFISFTFFHTHLLSQSINGLLDKNVFAGDVNNQRFYRLCVLIVKTLTSLVALLKPARERQSKILKCVRHELHDYFLSLKQ